ncbi:hypothetical protein ACHHYP_04831 [Achlya hypogyna]|uniref:Uncharacterized protein n=1 Tax=Achlya hypogyna TaxID=1202772 RepID=A0A1V9YZR1_ACHHY|nr:hypothetical protein ACHHYP_04831 [Achlya hypogyna]
MAAWVATFRDRVGDVIEGGLTVDLCVKVPLLEEMAGLLEAHQRMDNGDTKPLQESLLALGVLLLKHVEHVSIVRVQHLCYRLLILVLQRDEFLLGHLGFDFNTQDVRMDGDRESWRLVGLYRKLLGDAFTFTSALLRRNVLSTEAQALCAAIAARAYFVFPLLQASFVDICNWRACQLSPTRPQELQTTLTAQRRCDMDKCTDTGLMDACPDVFHWGWLAKASDLTTLLPDDSPWRLLLATDGTMFVRFVEAFVEYLTTVFDRCIPGQAAHVNWAMVPGYTDLMHLFAPFVYDAIVWLNHVPAATELAISAMFPMTHSLGDSALDCATRTMANPRMVTLLVPCAMVGLQRHPSCHPVGLTRTLGAVSRWLTAAAQPFAGAAAGDHSCGGNNMPVRLQSLHLYPSFASLDTVLPVVISWLSTPDDSVLVPTLQWLAEHLPHLPMDAKEVLVAALLHPHTFFPLFLHWSPRVRRTCHRLLVYQLFRHDRRQLQLASDAYALRQQPTPVKVHDLAKVSDSPNLMLDISSASKVDTHLFVLTAPAADPAAFPEALSIFVDEALDEYAGCLIEYYAACAEAESALGRRLWSDEVVAPPTF